MQSPLPGVTMALQLCGADGIRFKDQTYVPDSTKGYFQFSLSHAFPVSLFYQTALHPNVVSLSYASLLHQNLNYEHQMARYHPTRDVRDRVIGGIAAVDFPRPPSGGWRVDPKNIPAIDGVAFVYKQAAGMDRVLGEHVTGRNKYTVSMEVLWPLEQSGFAVAMDGRESLNKDTPPDFAKAGYDYFPYEQAPKELIATYSPKKERVVAQWKGRRVHVLMGGINTPVHYAGVGVVRYGAEPTAKIQRLAASGEDPLSKLADSMLNSFRDLNQRT